jgi:hypothetical protein
MAKATYPSHAAGRMVRLSDTKTCCNIVMKSEAVSMPTNCWAAASHSGAAGIPCKIHSQADEQFQSHSTANKMVRTSAHLLYLMT